MSTPTWQAALALAAEGRAAFCSHGEDDKGAGTGMAGATGMSRSV